jgi:hypothetical protein
MTPTQLLLAARSLMERPESASDGAWPRASALLARQALEVALDEVWASRPGTRGLAQCSMRTQLLCAAAYLDPDLAATVSWTWSGLSEACHHHGYDLAPTAAELNGWMDVAGHLIEQVGGQASQPH